jgi:hypothetical protein
MDVDSVLASSPRRLRAGSEQGAASYQLADDLIAVHGSRTTPHAILTLEGGDIVVERLDAASAKGGREAIGPVYRQVPGGTLAVPTGRVFVRFAQGESASRHEADLAARGYRVEEVLTYAPHAAWLRAASGDASDALRDLGRVADLPGVERVEPQLVTEAGQRR